MTDTEQTPKQRLATAMADLKLTIKATFIPWSKSRNAKPDPNLSERSLNWSVTLQHDGHDVLTTDYSAGIAHCPGYRPDNSLDTVESIKVETESGHAHRNSTVAFRGKPIMPDPTDVMHGLISDADAIDHPTFESWASDLGYSTDSRSAERVYQACLAIALALRAAVGDTGLATLREAAQDY